MPLGVIESFAGEPLPKEPYLIEPLPGITLNPIQSLSLRTFYFGSDPGDTQYCLENSEGDCLDEGPNVFVDLGGGVRIGSRLSLHYKVQAKDHQLRTKQAMVKLRTGIVSWEFGKDSIWMGPGYHGALLLSNHAEGFLLFKLETEDPFRLPWILSKMGDFNYLFFHGWLEDFRLMGHRLSWWPVSFLEIGANQTVIYESEKRFKVWELPKVFFNSEENIGLSTSRFNNDQRASLDMAVHLPFLRDVISLKTGKLYTEYGAEDLRAFWQKEDAFCPPVGFCFLGKGVIGGVFLTTGSTDFRAEYAQNSRGRFTHWYNRIPFVNDGVLMGHHMGRDADDLFVEIGHRWQQWMVQLSYDKERHGVSTFPENPEVRDQFAIKSSYLLGHFSLSGHLVYNRYKNTDLDPDPIGIDIEEEGSRRDEYAVGVGLSIIP